MNSRLAFPHRFTAMICLLAIMAALTGISFHWARATHAQNGAGQIAPIAEDLQQLKSEVSNFLDRSQQPKRGQPSRLSDSSLRQRLLSQLSAFERRAREINAGADETKELVNAVRELEEQLFSQATPD